MKIRRVERSDEFVDTLATITAGQVFEDDQGVTYMRVRGTDTQALCLDNGILLVIPSYVRLRKVDATLLIEEKS